MARYTEKREALVAIAARQHGYLTAHQALLAGYDYPRHHYHVHSGDRERIARGIFCLHIYPLPEREDLIVLSLMSHDRSGQPQAVFSHETALALHDLGDVNPARIHLTVPTGFRRQLPAGIVIHRAIVPGDESEERDGYRVTTPLRTLTDIAATPASWPSLEACSRSGSSGRTCRGDEEAGAGHLPATAPPHKAAVIGVYLTRKGFSPPQAAGAHPRR